MTGVVLFWLISISRIYFIFGKDSILVGYIGTHSGPKSERDGEKVSGALVLAIENVNADPNILQNYTLDYIFGDNENRDLRSVEVVTELWKQGAVAFFGPEDFCMTEARIAASWNLPMLSHKCADPSVSDKSIYPTFARTQPPSSFAAKSVVALLDYYQWDKFYVISERDDVYTRTETYLTSIIGNKTILGRDNFTGPYATSLSKSEVLDVVDRTYVHTRVYVVLASKTAFIDFARGVYNHPNVNPSTYVLISAQESPLFEDTKNGRIQPLFTVFETSGLSRKNNSVLAFGNVLQLVQSPPTNPIYETTWKDQVRERLYAAPFYLPTPDYFLTLIKYKPSVTINAAYLYDAVMVYARAVDEVLKNGGSITNGTAIIEAMVSKIFSSILGNDEYLDERGDAQGNLSVVALRPDDNPFGLSLQLVGQFLQKDTISVEFQEKIQVYDIVPVDEPECGFYGHKCIEPKDYTVEIVGGVLGGLAFVILLAAAILYRNWRFEQQLATLLWKINLNEIDFRQIMNSTLSIGSNFEIQSHTGSREITGSLKAPQAQIFTKTGVYRGNVVALKWILKRNVDLNRTVRLELKQMRDMRHDHVVGFVGACVESPLVAIVMEYCQRGSLEDVLENEDLKIDNMLKASLDFDIIKGMTYIHNTDIVSHGNLKSANCLIDSRWVLKIADFGLTEFKSGQTEPDDGEYAKYKKKMWTAPELLRMKSRPPRGTQAGDVYSFAIILYEIEGRAGPFGDMDMSPREIVERVISRSTAFRPDTTFLKCPAFINDTLKRCWAEDPSSRPDFKTCKRLLKPMQKGLKSNIFDNMMAIMERYASNLEGIVAERTAELIEEKKKTDSLLQSMLPTSVANQLKQGNMVQPETFESVTIYFSDICGFTALSAVSTPLQLVVECRLFIRQRTLWRKQVPQQAEGCLAIPLVVVFFSILRKVVDLLNDLYTCFDSIIKNYDVYKVETIGDAYMVVSGLPTRNGKNHAGEIASMSLNLLTDIRVFKIRHSPNDVLKLRIGIHSGSCVAGVVGLTMPRYCLFGDTVNTASRMESNGEALKIHVSPECCEILKDLGGYDLQERGLVAMKGKGEIATYWLLGEDSSVRERRRGNSADSGNGSASESDTQFVLSSKRNRKQSIITDSQTFAKIPEKPATTDTLTSSDKQDAVNDIKKLESLVSCPDQTPKGEDSDSVIIEQSILESISNHVKEHIYRLNSLNAGQQRPATSPRGSVSKTTEDSLHSRPKSMDVKHTASPGTKPRLYDDASPSVKVNTLISDQDEVDSLTKISVSK